jgi:CRP/FNR family transcriptional regulator, cyclic AMP receptor protein
MITKDKAQDIARGSGWLSRQPAKLQDDLLSRCHLRMFRDKETIQHVGDPCSGIYCVVEGIIRIEFAAGGGDYKIASVAQPVYWFGEAASFRRGACLVTVAAASPVTALHLPHIEFERLIETASFCRAFAQLNVDHFEECLQVLGQLLIGDVEHRVAVRLALLAEGSGEKPPVVPVTQADLAEMCGLSRPTVQQALANLERRGLVKPGYRRIQILDPAGLMSRREDDAEPAKRAV